LHAAKPGEADDQQSVHRATTTAVRVRQRFWFLGCGPDWCEEKRCRSAGLCVMTERYDFAAVIDAERLGQRDIRRQRITWVDQIVQILGTSCAPAMALRP